MKLCILCEHAYINLGTYEYYSSYSGEAGCSKEHWKIEADCYGSDLRPNILELMRWAERCPDYKEATEASLENTYTTTVRHD